MFTLNCDKLNARSSNSLNRNLISSSDKYLLNIALQLRTEQYYSADLKHFHDINPKITNEYFKICKSILWPWATISEYIILYRAEGHNSKSLIIDFK